MCTALAGSIDLPGKCLAVSQIAINCEWIKFN